MLDQREWLETDGLGGFASGTASLVRTRRYHGLLVVATTPPLGRMMLVNGFDAWLETDEAIVPLSTQRYAPDVLHPDGVSRLVQFVPSPWPTWRWRISGDADLIHEVLIARGVPRVAVRWRLTRPLARARLCVRPFLSGRDFHALHHENASFAFEASTDRDRVEWQPYAGVPGVRSRSNGEYRQQPEWYRQFLYLEERHRGLDDSEDLASPGVFSWDLTLGEAVWTLEPQSLALCPDSPIELVARMFDEELERRQAFPSALHRSADHYIVARGEGKTIIAGYPWFADWGRDTFIALRGLCIATGRLGEARDILLEWAGLVSEGMLPNRFGDSDSDAEFNSVDAALWFVIAVHDLLRAAAPRGGITGLERQRLCTAVERIVAGYAAGTRFGIRMDDDGLLAAGAAGTQLTWMDAKIGSEVVTPRIGKPVEVQALWLHALEFAGRESAAWRAVAARAWPAFQARFWNEPRGCLFDVIDVDHVSRRMDDRVRPNQILAVGGLPRPLVTGARARQIVDAVEVSLLTPLGLRTLAPGEPDYAPRYEGDVWSRDHAYHQGTVWPWLMGPFVDAWIGVRGGTATVRQEAHDRFIAPLLGQLDRLGFGHLPEIADALPPHTPRGCPFQAWSLGELLRMAGTTGTTGTAGTRNV